MVSGEWLGSNTRQKMIDIAAKFALAGQPTGIVQLNETGLISSTFLPLTSNPPQGAYKVINLWVDPDSGKLTIQYDNTPTP